MSVASTKSANTSRYLTFYLADECYGVDITKVREIIALQRTTKIPKTPIYMKGVMNLRGNIIPVVDLRIKFGLSQKDADMYTAIVIVALFGINIGFIVDRVDEVVGVDMEQMSETPRFGTKIDTGYIEKMIRTSRSVVMALNLNTLISAKELEGLDNVSV